MYKILIVEDDRGLNQGITLALEREDTAFLQAHAAGEAREILEREQVDMALLDVNLPDGSGYDLLQEIRSHSKIPVLLITANDLESDEITGFSWGRTTISPSPSGLWPCGPGWTGCGSAQAVSRRVKKTTMRTAGTIFSLRRCVSMWTGRRSS